MRLTIATMVLVVLLAPVAQPQGDSVTLVGEYVWKQGKPRELRGVFTPVGDGEWTVDFFFKHYGKHVFTGRVKGTMEPGGELDGEVLSESEKREFVFSGVFRDGTFEGRHAELTRKGRKPTGTLVLRRE